MLFRHEPDNYNCPFCIFLAGGDNGINRQQDLVHRDDLATAFIAPRWWPNNEGHVLIIPNTHFENIYGLPQQYAYRIQDVAQQIAIAFKHVYRCEGVSTRQHNEPAGDQDVWHYHLHVFPRYVDDNLYGSHRTREFASPVKRWEYAEKLRQFLLEKEDHG